MNFIAELRRRHVIRTVSIYLGVAWMLIGACDIFFPMLGVDDGLLRWVIFVLLGGIPIVGVASWFLETTEGGVVIDTRPADGAAASARSPVDLVVITLLGVALAVSVAVNLRSADVFRKSAPLLAVVPFEDLSEVGRHITHGLADELVNLLGRDPGLRLMDPDLSFSLMPSGVELLTAARELGADFLVRGSIKTQGGEFRLLIRLVDVTKGEISWSDEIAGALNDVFVAQPQVAAGMRDSLNIALQYAFTMRDGRLSPVAVDTYLQATERLRRSGSLAEIRLARTELEAVLGLEPEFVSALGRLCSAQLYIYKRTQDPDDFRIAEADCARAEGVDPDAVDVRLALANLYRLGGQLDRAEAVARGVVASHPHVNEAYTHLANIAWTRGELDAAEVGFRQVVRGHDRDWRSHLDLGNFYAQTGRYDEAVGSFERVTELNPDDFIGYASLGVTYYEAGDLDRARELVTRSLELDENSRSYFNLGLIETNRNDREAAARAFSRSVALNPQNYRAQIFVGMHLDALGDEAGSRQAREKALAIIDELLEINPLDAEVLGHGATVASGLGQRSRGLELAERARVQNTGNPKVQFNIGLAYWQAGETDRGVAELVESLRLGYPPTLFVDGEVTPEILNDPRIQAALAEVSAD